MHLLKKLTQSFYYASFILLFSCTLFLAGCTLDSSGIQKKTPLIQKKTPSISPCQVCCNPEDPSFKTVTCLCVLSPKGVFLDVKALYKKWVQADLVKDSSKKRFVQLIAQGIHQENLKIIHKRKRLKALLAKPTPLTPDECRWIDAMKSTYRAKTTTHLMDRMDIVPASLGVAQAIEESGWGKSKKAHQYNYFGLRRKGKGAQMRYASPRQGIAVYVTTLNRHSAYSAFRSQRKIMRKKGGPIHGTCLTPCLKAYCPISWYPKRICSIIQKFQLHRLDATYP